MDTMCYRTLHICEYAGDWGLFSLSFSFRPKPSIGAEKLSFLVARFAFVALADDPVLVLSPAVVCIVFKVLDVPFNVESPNPGGTSDARALLRRVARS